MAIIAFVSPKGSPGVTTTALACTLSWHSRVVLAECDPAGGSLMAGYLGGALEGPRGIGELAVSELRDGRLEQEFWGQLVDLDAPKRQRLLLPGLANPAQAGSVTPLWGRFAEFFTRLEHENPGFDVLADCGRLHVANPPWPILRAASAVLVVTSARLPDLSNAAATIEAISRDLRDNGVPPGTVRLVVVGGGHGKGEISRALGVPVAAHLPIDRQTAQVLSYGGTVRGRRPLMRAAASLEPPIRSMVDRRRARTTWNTVAPPMPPVPAGAQQSQHMPPGPAGAQQSPHLSPAPPTFSAPPAAHQHVPHQHVPQQHVPHQGQHLPPPPPPPVPPQHAPAEQQSAQYATAGAQWAAQQSSAAERQPAQHAPAGAQSAAQHAPAGPQSPAHRMPAGPQSDTQHMPVAAQQFAQQASAGPRQVEHTPSGPQQTDHTQAERTQAERTQAGAQQTRHVPTGQSAPHQTKRLPPSAPPASNGPITEELPRAV